MLSRLVQLTNSNIARVSTYCQRMRYCNTNHKRRFRERCKCSHCRLVLPLDTSKLAGIVSVHARQRHCATFREKHAVNICRSIRVVCLAVVAVMLLSSCVTAPQSGDMQSVDWPLHNLDLAGSRFSKLNQDRKSTRLNSSHSQQSRMPSSA